VASVQGEFDLAHAMYEESLAIKRELGDKRGIATSLTNLAGEALRQGNFAVSRTLDIESMAISRELAYRRGIANSLEGLACVGAELGNFLLAATLWGAAERLRTETGARWAPHEQLNYDRRVAAARTGLGDNAAFDRAWQEGHQLTLEQAIELALK